MHSAVKKYFSFSRFLSFFGIHHTYMFQITKHHHLDAL